MTHRGPDPRQVLAGPPSRRATQNVAHLLRHIDPVHALSNLSRSLRQ